MSRLLCRSHPLLGWLKLQGREYQQTLDQLLELHAWQDERVREGLRAADAGEFVSSAEMERLFDKHRGD